MQSVFSRGALFRFSAYLALWFILIGFSISNLLIGCLAAACATWISVLLFPISDRSLDLVALARLTVRLPWQSLLAGADVARRALDPRMPLRPGFITYATTLESGPRRSAYRALMSLQPGTMPVSADEAGDLLIHCLDVGQPVAAQLAAEEALFVQATGGVHDGSARDG